MKKILVVSYSQSGQLNEVVRSVLAPLTESGRVEVVFETLRPVRDYPFPWTAMEFVDAFPESLEEIPCRLKPFQFDPDAEFDAIVLAYQVWYLSPSIPVAAFLQSPEAARVMRDRPVITIIGCRNMWLLAQEKVKARILLNGGTPAANIVLGDRAPNLLGVVSIAAWMLTGKKERFLRLFPKPGISETDIADAARFGDLLLEAVEGNAFSGLQPELNRIGAAPVVPSYILFEHRISKIFKVWAWLIRRRGGPGNPARRLRLRVFIGYLLTAVFLLAPIATVVTALLRILKKDRINAMVTHFAENRIPTDAH